MIKSVNHIGIAVKDLDQSIENYSKIFKVNSFHREIVEDQKVQVASFKVGDVLIELTAPTSEDSPIAKFIDKRGEGIHHIAFATEPIDEELDRLSETGINLIDKKSKPGAHDMDIAFLHPKSANGVLIELCSKR